MGLTDLLTETATIVRHGTAVDEYGNIVAGTSTSTPYPARLEQLTAEELVRDRDTIIANWRMFLGPDADISPYDRVEARGHVFEVTGLPNEQRRPAGIHHLEVQLRFVA